MKKSKALYGFWDGEDFSGIVWETELGKVVTIEGKLNPNRNLMIREVETNNDVEDIELRSVLMSILPIK